MTASLLRKNLRSPRTLAIVFAAVFAVIGVVYLLISSAATAPTILSPSNGASTIGVTNIEVSTSSRSKTLQGFVYVNGVKMPGKLTYVSSRKYVYKNTDGSTGLNMMQFNKGNVQVVAELGGAKGSPITLNNTATARFINPYDGLTYARKFSVSGLIDLPTTTATTAKLLVDGAALPGSVVPRPNGWGYQNPDGSYDPTLATGSHTLQISLNNDAYKSWPIKVMVSDTLEVKILSPTEGQTGLANTIDPTFKIDNPQTDIKLLVDGQYLNGSVQYLPQSGGWKYRNQDGTTGINLANGKHTIQVDNAGAKSVIVNFTVGATTTTTTTTTGPTTSGATWGDHMGVSMMVMTNEYIDKTAALGVKWIRMSVESTWGFDQNLMTYAHSKGLKVLQACQKSGKTYYDNATDITNFANYCASWVDKGADAIEIGNEFNHMPFYNYNGSGSPDSTFISQAKYTDATVNAIRAKSSTIPIVNAGWSPEPSPRDPPTAMDKLLANSNGSFATKASGIAHHPYQYDVGPYGGYYAFWLTRDVYKKASARSFDKPVWLTEIGGPSATGSYTLSTQAQLYKDYISAIGQMRTGTSKYDTVTSTANNIVKVPVSIIFWHTIKDGQSSSMPGTREDYFGLYDSNGALKPAGQVVKTQAPIAW